ncbi:hypothetical protein CC1G_05786 [Coprinopsis cinerea okayama7|uniref:DUF6534 domain-containing protein n=1 Tax=Coprinopsis cinerea (strain Okayama-7 / 130 / ATCC MYA-4618 / FGSC 9003) TaxID=240176 RepID=A8NLC0_COPC7|nr:hypothetical protein CC1G_05786 [Coprinopsis cinerea okayama7\|eukprot:XP_001834649.1 hypothetical protein CC1G_05786 [Coprinopsis cinerea okayama7\
MELDLHRTFGALVIGSTFAVFLFGIVTLQCHAYYSRFDEDRKLFKYLVAVVWVLELAHTIAISYEIYTATITHYGQPNEYDRFPGFGLATLLGGSITMCVQAFFAFRVHSILPPPYRYIGLFCIFLTVARCVTSFYAGIEGIMTTSMVEYTERFRGMLAALFISGAAIDVVIAVSMLWFLSAKRESAMPKVTRLLDKLVAWTIGTGLLTSVAAVVIVIVFMIQDHTLIWLALYTFLAKLYSNSLLCALNARSNLREEAARSSISHSRTRLRELTSSNGRPGNPVNPISIEMMTTTQMEVDDVPIFYTVPLQPHATPSVASDDANLKGHASMIEKADDYHQDDFEKDRGKDAKNGYHDVV